MSKRVFILGAGFSKAVGMPLATELTEPAIRRASYFDETSEEDNECHRWLNSFRKRIFGSSGRILSIEEVFHYAYFDMEAFKLFEQLSPRSKLARRARQWLNELQIAVIEELWDQQTNIVKERHHSRLSKFGNAVSTDDIIVVFNYDQLAESALDSAAKKWNHGFELESVGIPVLKLHGSIDWIIARCADEFHPLCRSPNCTVLHQLDNSSECSTESPRLWFNGKERGRVTTSLIRVNSKELLDKNLCTSLSFEWEEKKPGIAALGAYKPLSTIPALGSIWRKACLALHEVEEVVVIGFSFSDFDATASLQFGGVTSIRVENNKPIKRLTVIDPNAERILDRAKPIFEPVEVRAFSIPHEEFDWSAL